jgi:hypothetical protein
MRPRRKSSIAGGNFPAKALSMAKDYCPDIISGRIRVKIIVDQAERTGLRPAQAALWSQIAR